MPTYTLVWTAGNQPNPLLKTLPSERNRAGAVIVDSTLRVNGFTNVWAVGDCAQIPDPDHEGPVLPSHSSACTAGREGGGREYRGRHKRQTPSISSGSGQSVCWWDWDTVRRPRRYVVGGSPGYSHGSCGDDPYIWVSSQA